LLLQVLNDTEACLNVVINIFGHQRHLFNHPLFVVELGERILKLLIGFLERGPEPVAAGLIVAGLNPVAVDSVSAWMMGFDPLKLAVIRNAFDRRVLPLAGFAYEDIRAISNNPDLCGELRRLDPARVLKFKPHFGWSGHVEL
jgi:hypothetical protein